MTLPPRLTSNPRGAGGSTNHTAATPAGVTPFECSGRVVNGAAAEQELDHKGIKGAAAQGAKSSCRILGWLRHRRPVG